MSEIDPAKIAVQVAIACTRALDQRCPEIGATFVKIGDAHAFFHGTTALSNVVIASGCFGAIAGEDIDNVEEFFRRRQVAVTVLIPNIFGNERLIHNLRVRGYEEGPPERTWCSFLLPPERKVEARRIRVSRVEVERSAEWAQVVAAGFREYSSSIPDAEIDRAVLDYFYARGFAENCHAFLAHCSGDPAGGGVLYTDNEIACLGTASTRFSYRGRGVHKALIAERLRFAAEAGCKAALSMTQEGSTSERNLINAGFVLVAEGLLMIKEVIPLSSVVKPP